MKRFPMAGFLFLVTLLYVSVPSLSAQEDNGIDPEALIDRILSVEKAQRAELHDVIFDAEYIEGEQKDDGFKEKVRFDKRIYLKFFPDTVWFHEQYLAYYKDGKLQSEKDLRKEAASRMEKKKKRNMRDISYPMLKPFYPDERALYDITYRGVPEETIDGYVCHHFRVKAKEESDTLINGDFYFDAETFHPVRIDFSPAKLVKKLMFKLNELNMSLTYGPTGDDNIWLPRQFHLEGRGKAGLLFGVHFGGTEYYRNPIINSGVSEDIFKGDTDE